MRKILKVSTCLLLALVMVFGVSVASLAASKSDVVELIKVADESGTDVEYTLEQVEGSEYPILTEPKAAEKIGNVEAKDLAVVWQSIVTAPTPAVLTFNVPGSADQTVYVFHHDGNDWELVGTYTGTTISHTFADLSPVGIVVKGNTAPETTTPTGDNANVALWGILMVVAAAGAFGTIAYSKKRRTN